MTEVANHVKNVAKAYHQYEQAINGNDFNGALVFAALASEGGLASSAAVTLTSPSQISNVASIFTAIQALPTYNNYVVEVVKS